MAAKHYMERLERDLANIDMIDDATVEALREMTHAQRLQLMFVANEIGRSLMRVGMKWFHPDWDEARISRAVVDILLHDVK